MWEQLNEMETDATRTSFPAVSCHFEEGKVQLSQFDQPQPKDRNLSASSTTDQMKAESGREDCGGAETTRNPDLNLYEYDSNSSETEVSNDEDDDQDGNNSDCQLKLLSDSEPNTKDHNKDWKESRSSKSHVKAVKSFSCPECGEQFLHERSLQKHMRVTSHSGLKSSSCCVDKKRVRVKQNVDSSRKVQTKLKSFSCDDCGKSFSSISHLNSHMSVYTGQKPFACELCEKRFGLKSFLKIHLRVHTRQKLFACELCGGRFTAKQILEKHECPHRTQSFCLNSVDKDLIERRI
uniref:C2H2-type domain-containing protein n=1 Tax=Nothobranchius rachovii TaxID=451742 RepID=A0A1A8QP84_9TELE